MSAAGEICDELVKESVEAERQPQTQAKRGRGPNITRRRALQLAAATGAASIGVGTATADDDGEETVEPTRLFDRPTLNRGTTDPFAYYSARSLDFITPWELLGGEDNAMDEYEYEQRLSIYKQSYNWEQFTERQLTGIENQGDLLSRSIMEDGLEELFYQAEDDEGREDATEAAQNIVRDEFKSIYNQLVQHYEQTALALQDWFFYLANMESDLEDAAPVGYTMTMYCPYTGDLTQWSDHDLPMEKDDDGFFEQNPTHITNPPEHGEEGDPVYEHAEFKFRDSSSEPALIPSLPYVLTDFSTEYDDLEWDSKYSLDTTVDLYNEYYEQFEDEYDPDDPSGGDVNEVDFYETYVAVKVSPPNPVDFDVDEDHVEDISDHPDALAINGRKWYLITKRLKELYDDAIEGVETWANSNYTDVRDNPDDWDVEDFISPSALRDSANEAENPAEAALALHGMGIETNRENDVIVRFSEYEDEDGELLEVPGYLAWTDPDEDGLPVGETIDPDEKDGTIFLAHWIDEDQDDDLDEDNDAEATYTGLEDEFEIIATAEDTDYVGFEARDVSDPDYDWEEVVENLEEQNQALLDAQEQTLEAEEDDGLFGGGGWSWGDGDGLNWIPLVAGGGAVAWALGRSSK